MKDIKDALRQAARNTADPSGADYRSLNLRDTVELAEKFKLSRREVEIAALEEQITPERYQRSIGTVGLEGQIRLLKSRAGVIGAGGLGGLVVELLARMGFGSLVVIDHDSFSENNLNRQILSTEHNLGQNKAESAARRAALVNGAVEVQAVAQRGGAENLLELLDGCTLALDCLDNLSSRFALEQACGRLKIPLVHAAIAGFVGQLAVIDPGRPLFASIYGAAGELERGAEVYLGNPAATPAVLAAMQVNEAVKIAAGLEGVLRNRLLIVDLISGESTPVDLISQQI
jgi:molybdopterin-synthase adenylyltransferase